MQYCLHHPTSSPSTHSLLNPPLSILCEVMAKWLKIVAGACQVWVKVSLPPGGLPFEWLNQVEEGTGSHDTSSRHAQSYFRLAATRAVGTALNMKSMKLVIPLHTSYWSIHTKDESKRGTALAFIFGVNWLWRCGVTASFGVFCYKIKCKGKTSFMEFMWISKCR